MATMIPNPNYLTPLQAGKLVGQSKRYMLREIHEGRLRAENRGTHRRPRFVTTPADVDHWRARRVYIAPVADAGAAVVKPIRVSLTPLPTTGLLDRMRAAKRARRAHAHAAG
jgi:excisionase family DNA binding protein